MNHHASRRKCPRSLTLATCAAALLAASACPGPRGGPVAGSISKSSKDVTSLFVLDTDPRAVDRVRLEGSFEGSPKEMKRRAPGRFEVRLGGLPAGIWLRYRFSVHRSDQKRWVSVADPYARQLDASHGRWSMRFVRRGDQAPPRPRPLARRPAFSELVIYELCPREVVPRGTPFADLKSVPEANGPRFGSAFRAITKRIESGYYERLGVTALELMPVLAQGWRKPKGKSDGTSNAGVNLVRPPWGYQAMSWYAINGDYGTADELVALIDAAHRRGLAVLADVSLEHGYGGEHNGLVTDLWPKWRVAKPRNPWGLLELDLEAKGARRFVVGGLRRLLVDYGFDGLRLDWTEKVPPKTWKAVVAEVRRFAPKAILISENPTLPLLTEARMDGTWDFFFHWEAPLLLRRVYRNWDGFSGRLVDTQEKLVENLRGRAYPPHGARAVAGIDPRKGPPVVRYIESHDLPRIARRRVKWQHGGNHLMDVNGDKKTPDWLDHGSQQTSRLGATLLATLPGAIMLFQGQEHGAADELRWAYDPLEGPGDATTLAHYRKLLQARRRHRQLRENDLRILLSDSKRHVLAYSRGDDPDRRDDDAFVAVLNFAPVAIRKLALTLPQKGTWREILSGKTYRGPKVQLDLPVGGSMLLQHVDSGTRLR